MGKLSKTWTNVLYILQVGTNIIPVSICGGDNQGSADRNKRKRKGGRNGVASVEPDNTSLGIADHLRYLFSNPKNVELMQWWNLDKHNKADGKLRHLSDAR